MTKILSSVPTTEDITEIQLQPDGTWLLPKNGPKKRKIDEITPKARKVEIFELSDEENVNNTQNPTAPLASLMDEAVQEPIIYSSACYKCGKEYDTKRCSRCKRISYCGVECQKADWEERHRDECYPEGELPPRKIVRTESTLQPVPKVEDPLPRTPVATPVSRVDLGSSADYAIVLSDSD